MNAARRNASGKKSERGQAFAETALMVPIIILLVGGMIFAAIYAFRSTASSWGIFITGVATGSYNSPATSQAESSVAWPDITDRFQYTRDPDERIARSSVWIEDTRQWMAIDIKDMQKASATFRLWRFYPGPGGGE